MLDIEFNDEMIIILREDFPSQEILFHLTDVSERDEVLRAFQEVMYKFKQIDMVITSAGILDERNYQLMVDINLVGAVCDNISERRIKFSCLTLRSIGRSHSHKLHSNRFYEPPKWWQRRTHCQHIVMCGH